MVVALCYLVMGLNPSVSLNLGGDWAVGFPAAMIHSGRMQLDKYVFDWGVDHPGSNIIGRTRHAS